MPLTEPTNLASQAAQIAQSMFAPATNVLSSALNNAVDMGRRMVDLQSHQEDIFMSEREKLRLANERKGLEARRIFEADRAYDTDVFRDTRNFAESARRDERDFLLKDFATRQGLAFQGQGLDLQRRGQDLNYDLGLGNLAINERQLGVSETRADTEFLRYQAQDRRAALIDRATEKKLNETSAIGPFIDALDPNALQEPSFLDKGISFITGRPPEVDNEQVKRIQDFKKKFPVEILQKEWTNFSPKQQETISKLIEKGGIEGWRVGPPARSVSPDKRNVGNLFSGFFKQPRQNANPANVTQPMSSSYNPADYPDGIPVRGAFPGGTSPVSPGDMGAGNVLPPRPGALDPSQWDSNVYPVD